MDAIKIEILLKQQLIKTYESRPPVGSDQDDELSKAKKDLAELNEKFVTLAMQQPSGSASQVSAGDANYYVQSQILMSHLGKLGRFTGNNCEATNVFLQKVKGLIQACPTLGFDMVYGAVKAHIAPNVQKTLDNAQVKDFKSLEEALKKNYGLFSNVYQRLENWLTAPKPTGTSFTQHHCDTTNALEPIIDSFREELIKMRKAAGQDDYKPDFRDAFGALKILKCLQSIRQDSDDVYSSIIIELKSFQSSEQIAQRAEALNTQTSFKSVNTTEGGIQGSSNQNNKKKNQGNRQNGNGGDGRQSQPKQGGQNNGQKNQQGGNRGGHQGRGRGGRGGNRGGGRGGHRGGQNSNGSQVSRNPGSSHQGGNYQGGNNSHSNGGGGRGHYRGSERGRGVSRGYHYSHSPAPQYSNATFHDAQYQPLGEYNDELDNGQFYDLGNNYATEDDYDFSGAGESYVSFDNMSKN